jgi:hypothetical protein
MQTKYPFYGYKRHGPGGPALFGAALLMMLSAPLALAGKPTCDEPPYHPSCGFYYTLQDARVGYANCDTDVVSCTLEEISPWEGPYQTPERPYDHLWGPEYNDWTDNTLSAIPRPCTTPHETIYLCNDENAFGGRVSIDVGAYVWEWIPGKKKMKPIPEYCDLLNAWLLWDKGGTDPMRFGPHYYNFGAEDGCSLEGCTLGALQFTQAPRNPFYNLTGLGYLGIEDADGNLITELPDPYLLEVWADADCGGAGEPDCVINFPVDDKELNIFTEPQALPIQRFRFIFRHGGTTQMTECATTPGTVQNVWFITEPVTE